MSATVQDIDAYGKQNQDGSPVVYINDDAISNALYMFLTSKRGDFLYNPGSGGVLDSPIFKTMTPVMLEVLSFNIRNALTNNFTPYITIQQISITPDKVNRILEVAVVYRTNSGATKQTSVYVNSEYHTKNFEYTNIIYTGQNLYDWCLVIKSEMSGQILELDPISQLWTWKNYILVNLTTSDPFFDAILMLANS